MKCACGCQTQEIHESAGRAHTMAAVSSTGEAALVGGSGSPLSSSGKTVEGSDPDDEEASGCGCGHSHEEEEAIKPYEKVALVLAGAFLAVALVGEFLLGLEIVSIAASFASIIAGLVIVFPETIESIKAKSIDINVLLIVAIIGAIYVQAYEEAAAVLFLFSVGEYLEGRAMRKSNDAVKDLAKLAPDVALVKRNGKTIEVPTDQVELEETVFLKPGMTAPLDGIIIKGASSFNDAAITGESVPVYKTVGDKVYAASSAVDGSCEFTTTSTVANSTLAKISEMVQAAQKQKSERERFVQRFAKVYTPLVIVAAVLIALVPPALSSFTTLNLGDFNTWIYRACELLVISCPCAFVISTPVTVVSALTRAARIGVLVKGGAYFEEGARIKVVAFDKTGTLTEGKPEVIEVISAMSSESASLASTKLVEIAASLEQHSTHPLARALVLHAARSEQENLPEAQNITELAGKGVTGEVEGTRYAIGSSDYIISEIGLKSEVETQANALGSTVGTVLYLAQVGQQPALLGTFVLADKVRTDSPKTIQGLHATKQQLKAVMLTGDNNRTAQSVAAQVGVDEVHAQLLPQDKTTQVKRLSEEYGPTAFVGDGINDAPSIATANVGIAMGGAGSDAALSSADVVLMADDISALPKFFNLAQKTVAILKQNVVLAIGLKVLVAILVVLGVAQMWMAVLADTGVSLLVIANGMRLLRTRI